MSSDPAGGPDAVPTDAVHAAVPTDGVQAGAVPQPRRAAGIATLLAESRLTPVELDLKRVFAVCIGLWVLAGLVCGVLLALGRVDARPVAICGLGVALGLLALSWEHRRRRPPSPPAP